MRSEHTLPLLSIHASASKRVRPAEKKAFGSGLRIHGGRYPVKWESPQSGFWAVTFQKFLGSLESSEGGKETRHSVERKQGKMTEAASHAERTCSWPCGSPVALTTLPSTKSLHLGVSPVQPQCSRPLHRPQSQALQSHFSGHLLTIARALSPWLSHDLALILSQH